MTPDIRARRRAQQGPDPTIENDPSMRAMHLSELKQRIECATYTVDSVAVAEALLRRPDARREILPGVSRSDARSRRAAGRPPQS